MRRIYIVANFCRPFDGTVDGRFLYLAEMLAKQADICVELITSDFSHSTKQWKLPPKQDLYGAKLTYCHEPGYIGHAGLKRLWSHRVWGKNVLKYVKTLPKPDMIYCAIPSLTAAVEMASYCKKNKIKFAVDVQDLWPEATFMLIKNKLLRKMALPMTWYVNKAYRAADLVVAVSQTYADRAMQVNSKAKGKVVVYLGNNGIVYDGVLTPTGGREPVFSVCYIGTLSYSYDIKCVIDALYRIKVGALASRSVKFKVMGDGPLRDEFENYAKEKNVDCEFMGRLPYEQMVSEMCKCDVLVNPITKAAAQSITNKVGDYALSGLPVINTQECQEYRDLIEEYKCGINCAVGNSSEVAEAIVSLLENPELRQKMGISARKLGVERFDRRHTYQEIVDAVLACME